MDTQSSQPIQHPLRPYSVSPQYDDFSWSTSSTSTPPSLRSNSTPTPKDRYSSSLADLDSFSTSAGTISAGTLIKSLVTTSLLSFTGVALVQPFEVGKTLLQVQWVPKDGVLEQIEQQLSPQQLDQDVIQDENEAESYFADLSSVSAPSFAPPPLSTSSSSHLRPPPHPTDPSGYLPSRTTTTAPDGSIMLSRPEWVMPIVVQGGVWDMIKSISRWKGEGLKSLWKGQLTTFIYDTLSTTLQPTFLSILTLIFSPIHSNSFSSSLPLIYSPKPLPLLILSTISHTLTTLLLSPLDLVRTRLIVQSAQPSHRKYSNPFSTLRTITLEEGGLTSLYTHPNLLYPSLLEGLLRPLIQLSTPLLITRYFHLEPSTSPLSFATTELLLSSIGLLITIPIETIRKRLQVQSRAEFVRAGRAGGVGKPWRSSVELRPTPYAGIVETVYRILTEETGKIPRRRRLRRRSSTVPPNFNRTNSGMSEGGEEKEDLSVVGLGGSGGLRQLYRGLSMGLAANGVVYVLGLVAGGSGAGTGGGAGGWAEM